MRGLGAHGPLSPWLGLMRRADLGIEPGAPEPGGCEGGVGGPGLGRPVGEMGGAWSGGRPSVEEECEGPYHYRGAQVPQITVSSDHNSMLTLKKHVTMTVAKSREKHIKENTLSVTTICCKGCVNCCLAGIARLKQMAAKSLRGNDLGIIQPQQE